MNNHYGFIGLHPAVSFLYYIGLFAFSMIFQHPYFLVSAFIAVVLLNIFHDGGKKVLSGFYFYIFIAIMILVINPLFSHRGSMILFYFLEQPITLESVVYGFMMMMMILTILIAFLSFQFVISEDKFMYLFSSFTPKTALLIMMSFRFVPLLKRRLQEITSVQKTRGVSVMYGSFKERARAGINVLHILLTWSLEEGLQTADSMKARGYGLGTRSSFYIYRFYKKDLLILIWFIVLSILLLIFGIVGFGKLEIYPQLEGLKLLDGELYIYGLFILFLFTPHVMEGRELVRWRYWK